MILILRNINTNQQKLASPRCHSCGSLRLAGCPNPYDFHHNHCFDDKCLSSYYVIAIPKVARAEYICIYSININTDISA